MTKERICKRCGVHPSQTFPNQICWPCAKARTEQTRMNEYEKHDAAFGRSDIWLKVPLVKEKK